MTRCRPSRAQAADVNSSVSEQGFREKQSVKNNVSAELYHSPKHYHQPATARPGHCGSSDPFLSSWLTLKFQTPRNKFKWFKAWEPAQVRDGERHSGQLWAWGALRATVEAPAWPTALGRRRPEHFEPTARGSDHSQGRSPPRAPEDTRVTLASGTPSGASGRSPLVAGTGLPGGSHTVRPRRDAGRCCQATGRVAATREPHICRRPAPPTH